jgi:hypothetical protein
VNEKIAGVYVVFGTNNRVYVGESADILYRKSLYVPRMLGCDWTIVRYMPGSTGPERCKMEKRIMHAYRKAGFTLVSKLKGEHGGTRRGTIGHALRWSPERRKIHSEQMRIVMNDPARLAAAAARMKRVNESRTPEERSRLMLRGWETRRSRSKSK